jgi:outer membrane receptor protein involved in Fe transport
MNLPTRILITAALGAIALDRAPAQITTPPVRLEPVMVTADLWSAPLERIPASVTVFDEAALQAGAVRHFGDLADQIPNFTWTGATSRPRYFQIRGIGESSQYEGETPDSTVRFLIDDLEFTGLGTVGSAFDVHQVEVLRGPQAGAFGANAAGGLVRLVTNAPTPFWTGAIEASAGGDRFREGGFAMGGPLAGEQLMARLAIQQGVSDGFRQNVTRRRATNARDEFTARLRLTGNFSPLWRWEAALLYADFANGFDEFALNNNGRLTYSDQPGRDAQRSQSASLRGTFTGLAGARFTTVTSGSGSKSVYSYDDDWTADSYAGFSDLRRDRNGLNQELRLDSSLTRGALGWIDRWTLGAYFAETREKGTYSDSSPYYDTTALKTRYYAGNTALFGQFAHDLAAHARLTLGLRTERVNLDGRGIRTTSFAGVATSPAVTFHPSFTGNLLGGKVASSTTSPTMLSRSRRRPAATRRAASTSTPASARPGDPLTYGTETLWNYEAGLRGAWLEQRLTGEFTAFYLDRRNAQVRDSAGFGGTYRFFTANGHGAHIAGLEASARYALTAAWSLHATLASMESELDRFTLTNGNPAGGRRLANTPRYGATLGSRFRSASGVFANVELVARASQYDSNNQNEVRRAFRVVNGSLGYAWQAWTFTLWGRNVLNARYEKRVFLFGNEDPDYAVTRYEDRADPRQLGVSAGWRF